MISLSQWRVAIGLWNHCRIRLVNHNPLSNTPRSPFDIKCGFTVSKEDEVEDDSLFKWLWRSFVSVPGDTMCRLVTLMFYLLFLLLLSGDVELNPGPITVEQGIEVYSGSVLNYIQFVHR